MYQKGLPVFDMFPAAVSKQKIEIKSLQNILRSISWTIKTYFSEKQDQITQSIQEIWLTLALTWPLANVR